jgi:hypothetical protein
MRNHLTRGRITCPFLGASLPPQTRTRPCKGLHACAEDSCIERRRLSIPTALYGRLSDLRCGPDGDRTLWFDPARQEQLTCAAMVASSRAVLSPPSTVRTNRGGNCARGWSHARWVLGDAPLRRRAVASWRKARSSAEIHRGGDMIYVTLMVLDLVSGERFPYRFSRFLLTMNLAEICARRYFFSCLCLRA